MSAKYTMLAAYLTELADGLVSDGTRLEARETFKDSSEFFDTVALSNNIIVICNDKYRKGDTTVDQAIETISREFEYFELNYYDMEVEGSILKLIMENAAVSPMNEYEQFDRIFNEVWLYNESSIIRAAYMYNHLSKLLAGGITMDDLSIIRQINSELTRFGITEYLEKSTDMVNTISKPFGIE